MSVEIKAEAPPPSFLNKMLDNKLSTTTVSTNSAAQTTKTTTYPAGAQTKGK